jgi:oligogalacturonide lyase
MGHRARGTSRRAFLVTVGAGLLAGAEGNKGRNFPPEWRRYADPTTEADVYRLTDPAHRAWLPAYYNRAIARSSGWLVFAGDREGSPQAYRMDLKSGETRLLTEAEDLDAATLTLTPDNREICFFAGRSLRLVSLATLRDREIYRIAEGWERGAGMSVGADGTHATFIENRQGGSRLRMAPLAAGAVRTVIEAPVEMSHPLHRPGRAQLLYRRGGDGLWLTNLDGRENHRLKLAPGSVACANWSHDGRVLLYLNLPEDPHQLHAIREYAPDTATDKLVSKTSQFASFGANRDTSVFVGASANKASPTVLLLLRITQREMTLCEHKAADPAAVAPIFSPDSQHIYFQSDRDGKPALYSVHVDRLVEKTDVEAP